MVVEVTFFFMKSIKAFSNRILLRISVAVAAVDDFEIVIFGHFGQVFVLLQDGQSGAKEIQRLVAY